jgi:hypothetical protein
VVGRASDSGCAAADHGDASKKVVRRRIRTSDARRAGREAEQLAERVSAGIGDSWGSWAMVQWAPTEPVAVD